LQRKQLPLSYSLDLALFFSL